MIDGFLKLTINLPTSIIFFAYAAIGTYFLILTLKSKEEVSGLKGRLRQGEVETTSICQINFEEVSRFPVPVQAEGMVMRTSNDAV